ncbi:MAG: hypothetical protein A2161_14475 [Candidatus Schekmanbacteria bacterium RBG_13_48_7]|uniref:Abnormal spindle-like microcephaly-associated protein ASH domain-containing protein n=1 Tax=Candidatus Schekmanbacteria bacterium RBG_13_48_7 TaxID=1817878 RepID=A0A1F7RZY2_9BACT|nr:MAG: hypothetical protein A2161_14475 [Candidatus Schekmanbacteria bacterium RBG_13_48_7]
MYLTIFIGGLKMKRFTSIRMLGLAAILVSLFLTGFQPAWCGITPDKTSIDFGPVLVGIQATDTLILTNTDPVNIYRIYSVQFHPSPVPPPEIVIISITPPTPDVDLAPGESMVIELGFTPSDTVAYTARLWIQTEDPDADSIIIPIDGSGYLVLDEDEDEDEDMDDEAIVKAVKKHK